jgi:hypothetical protein
MSATRLVVELRALKPGLARRRDQGSPMASIRLFCLECMGGSALEVKKCAAPECPLYLLRFGRRTKPQELP